MVIWIQITQNSNPLLTAVLPFPKFSKVTDK